MNLLYTVAWRGQDAEEKARKCYEQLRAATARGSRFPFAYPYEVALASQRSTGGEWLVAILAMCGTILDDAKRAETISRIEAWLAASGDPGAPGGQARPADHLKVASELGLSYAVTGCFGTFVGEPGPGDAEVKPQAKPGPEPARPATITTNDVAIPPETLAEAIGRAAAAAPLPTASTVQVSPSTVKGCATWGGGILIAGGGLTGLAGLLLGLLMTIGAFAVEPVETDLSGFFLALACIPLPMLLISAGLVGAGIFMLYQARKKRSTAVPQPG